MNAPDISVRCADAYRRLKNLKLVGSELGIPWQTVYIHLTKAGVPVTGDKSRYGSDKDRLAARAEQAFLRLVPWARNLNGDAYQPRIDFTVNGFGVDVKSSQLHAGHANSKRMRWAFSMKKQEMFADFIVCFGYHDETQYELFLIPGPFVRKYQTISLSAAGKSKWRDYQITPTELSAFFVALPNKLQ